MRDEAPHGSLPDPLAKPRTEVFTGPAILRHPSLGSMMTRAWKGGF